MTLKDLDIVDINLTNSLEEDFKQLDHILNNINNIDTQVSLEGEMFDKIKGVSKTVWNSKLMEFIKQQTKSGLNTIGTDILNKLGDLRDVKLNKLYLYKKQLEDSDLIENNQPIGGKVSNMLAIYHKLGNSLNYSDLENYLSFPTDIVKSNNVFSYISKDIIFNFLHVKEFEKDLQKFNFPTNILSNLDEVGEFVDSRTKLLLPSNTYGRTTFIMKIEQSKKLGTVVYNKKITIEEQEKIELPPISPSEALSLVNKAIKLGLNLKSVEYDNMKKYSLDMEASVKRNLKSVILKSPLAILNYRRLMVGLNRCVLGLKRSQIESLDLVEYIIKKGTKK